MLLTWSNEQAIREIYLKPFEMAVKQGGTHSVMTSYNYIGNQWAGACGALLNGVLREEWGFTGVTATDWFGVYGYMNSDLANINGGDRMLTNTGSAVTADTTSATALNRMRTASKNILYSLANSSIMNGVERGTPLWRQILNGVNIGVIALCVLLEAVFLYKLFRKKYDE